MHEYLCTYILCIVQDVKNVERAKCFCRSEMKNLPLLKLSHKRWRYVKCFDKVLNFEQFTNI